MTFGLTLATLVQAVGGVFIGLAVDRFGPRRFGVAGLALLGIAFALLGTADGSLLNWYLSWGLVALAALPVQASVWTSAVASRFTASRGMAFAVTLCGASIAAGVFPPMAMWLIGSFGWRGAFPVQALIWLAVSFPVIFLFFHGRYDKGRMQKVEDAGTRPADLPGATLREGLTSNVYHRLFIASLLFTFTVIALVVHFTAILGDSGASPMLAAGIASFVGWFSLAGRLGTGALLDRLPASRRGSGVPAAGARLPASSPGRRLVRGDGVRFSLDRAHPGGGDRRGGLPAHPPLRPEEFRRPLRRAAGGLVDRHGHRASRRRAGVRPDGKLRRVPLARDGLHGGEQRGDRHAASHLNGGTLTQRRVR
ncbi:MFS transporter [Novosphingobium panipatense]